MPVISDVGKKSFGTVMAYCIIYLVLLALGITMVVPFMITVSSSLSNELDYDRFSMLPKYLWHREDRYVRTLVYSFSKYMKWYAQAQARFEYMPPSWTTWRKAGEDMAQIDAMANHYLEAADADWERWKTIAADYSRFVDDYPLDEMLAPVSNVEAVFYLTEKYEQRYEAQRPGELGGRALESAAIDLMADSWGIPIENVYTMDFEKTEMRYPYWQQGWYPPQTAKYADFLDVVRAYRYHRFTPGVAGKWRDFAKQKLDDAPRLDEVIQSDDQQVIALWREFKADVAPASPAQPLAMRAVWRDFLDGEETRDIVGMTPTEVFNIDIYNRIAGTDYESIFATPFPVPADASETLRTLWDEFVSSRYPLRLIRIEVTPELTARYQQFLADRFKTIRYANRLLETEATDWSDFELVAVAPEEEGSLRSVWKDFVKNLPADERIITSSEHRFQEYLLDKYGSLEGINTAYGWDLARIEEAFPPFDIAYTVTFVQNETAMTFAPMLSNYQFILAFIFGRGRAIFVTFVLIAMTIGLTLTVNPMAAYALSRFDVRGKDKVLLFMLATMAFPAMVSAIPAYLLMRDLGLLNTFFALVLPGAANGMGIFILKGFFDSLPRELYEAATIDGAKEWQIFTIITLPMMKPILAINALQAFIMAYNGWQWALIICQDPDMWTLSVWMYQANQWWSQDYPWLVTAGFVVVSIPTLLVFLFCQKIIMRGIIVPSMK